MIGNIETASESFRKSHAVCCEVFAAAGREFVQPDGVAECIRKARALYTGGDEAAAVKEVEHARIWLNGILRKFLKGGDEYFSGRINELRYMSLDRDIVERMEARLRDFCAALMLETGEIFDQRIAAYKGLASTVNGARDEQFARNEHRERRAIEEAARKEQERSLARQRDEEQNREAARLQQESAEAEARAKRAQVFDELFC